MTEPITFEVVIYDDGTSSISEFFRREGGKLEYVGRKFLDKADTSAVVYAIRHFQKLERVVADA